MQYFLESLYLDFFFLTKVKFNVIYKIYFLVLKYALLLKNFFIFGYGRSSIKIFGKSFFYPNKYGLVSIQRVFVDNYFLRLNIDNCHTVIDVGAHVGEFHLFAKKYLNAKKIYSFEPMKKSYALLKKNIDPEMAFNYGIYSEKEARLFISNISTQLNSLKNQDSDDYNDSEVVECIGLDDFFENKTEKQFDLLKIDVEGAELEVILTAKKTMERCRYIIIEMSVSRKGSENFMKIINHLTINQPDLKIIALSNYHTGNRSIDILLRNEII